MAGGSVFVKEIVRVPGLEETAEFGYSQCVRAGPLVFIAGQCGLNERHEVVSSDFLEQARTALDRVHAAVRAAGGTLGDIVAMTVFLTDTSLGRIFTALRREYLGGDFPASALIGVHSLMPTGAMIEIQAIAVLGASGQPNPTGGPNDCGRRGFRP